MTIFVLNIPDYQIRLVMTYFYSWAGQLWHILLIATFHQYSVPLKKKKNSFPLYSIWVFLPSDGLIKIFWNDVVSNWQVILWGHFAAAANYVSYILYMDFTWATFIVISRLLVIFQFSFKSFQILFMNGTCISFKMGRNLFVVTPLIT